MRKSIVYGFTPNFTHYIVPTFWSFNPVSVIIFSGWWTPFCYYLRGNLLEGNSSLFSFVWESLYFWRIVSLNIEFRVSCYFLSAQNVPLSSGFRGSEKFTVIQWSPLLCNSLIVYEWRLCSLSLFFRNLIIICLGMKFFGFILFRICLAYWICMFMSFVKFRKFFLLLVQILHSFSTSSRTPIIQMLGLLL